jgi:hypothetical protein
LSVDTPSGEHSARRWDGGFAHAAIKHFDLRLI